MYVHKYRSYEEYVKEQIKGNKANATGQWGKQDEIKYLSQYLLKNFKNIKKGICHGTKQGNEQKWFSEFTGAHVIGTEISDVAEKYANTVRWDFNEVKPEWINDFDFVYSNAFDHTYDPVKCLKSWMSCVNKTGCCIIEWTFAHTEKYTSRIDPFGATHEEYSKLIVDCGFKEKDNLKYISADSMEKYYFVIVHK
jgi:hypothetical protein